MTYINAISSISIIDFKSIFSFVEATYPANLVEPDYKQWIPAMQLRRMSKIVRMGIACTYAIEENLKTIYNAENIDFEAIILGTGLGCIQDTVKFIDVINSVSTSSIPPTSFIQSTHNTMAGQIALLLSNNNYNMTYVQNGVSFEQALIDGHLKIIEGKNNVLVGALDEMTVYLQSLCTIAKIKNGDTFTEGSSFFNLCNIKDEHTKAELLNCMTYTLNEKSNIDQIILQFLAKSNSTIDEIDIIMSSSSKFKASLKNQIAFSNVICYEDYCGKYFTSSGFALFMACHILQENVSTINSHFNLKSKKLENILIVNNYDDKNLGLTLLKK